MIEEGARASLRDLKAVPPYDPGRPCTIEVEFGTSDAVEQFHHHPLVEVVDGRTVRTDGRRLVDGLAPVLLLVPVAG